MKFKKTIIGIMLVALLNPHTVHADETPTEPFEILTTAYYQGKITCTGVPVREGICAVKKSWVGKTALIYADNDGEIGELIGIYECLDTGFGGDADGDGIGSIQEGKAVDVYFPTLDKCKNYMKLTGGKVFIQLVDAEG